MHKPDWIVIDIADPGADHGIYQVNDRNTRGLVGFVKIDPDQPGEWWLAELWHKGSVVYRCTADTAGGGLGALKKRIVHYHERKAHRG